MQIRSINYIPTNHVQYIANMCRGNLTIPVSYMNDLPEEVTETIIVAGEVNRHYGVIPGSSHYYCKISKSIHIPEGNCVVMERT